uniref:C2H2-type domain-containing protein n=1 Tax=Oncorhynchus tshawytscha TaxID=74940 RepID=A0AAZ3R7M2_ONCTS
MDREKGMLMDEIEKGLWNLTEDNLRYLCERHGHGGKDGFEVKGMDHRSLRKILEEMWDNTDSMKSEEQGISWLVQLKEDIRRIQEEGSSADDDDAVDCDEEWNGEGGVQLPSNGLEAESTSPSQSGDCDAADCDEELDREVRDGLEVELSPEKHTPEQKDKRRPPKTLCRASPSTALIWGLKRVSVQLMDCRKTPGQKTSKKTHSCPQCGKSFATKDILERHLLTHTGEKQKNICAECGKVFSTFSSLTRHLKTHTGEKCHVSETTCSECGKTFSTHSSLRRHLLTHTGEKPYVCPRCKKGFNDPGNLKKHLRRAHPGEKLGVERLYREPCPHCGEKFPTKKALEEHLVTHTGEKPHQCSDCGKGFKELSSLKRHLRTHTGEKPYICPRCGKPFNDPGNLKKHIKRTHSREHSKEKPSENNVGSSEQEETVKKPVLHPCSHCGKKLSTKTRLNIHLKTHTVEKPHVCPDCGKSFAFRPSLTKHQKLSHSEHGGVKRHECSVCGKVFNQPGALRSHQRTH